MFAVIDLGSNSFHLLIAKLEQGHFTVIDRHSEKIQLAESISVSQHLTEAAMQRGLSCLKTFKQKIAQHPVSYLRVVGTQALRQALNANEFLAKAKAIGFDIEVISGEEEARHIYLGIYDSLDNDQLARLVIDIGGASTEIAFGTGEKVNASASLATGCVSWRDKYFASLDNKNPLAFTDEQLAKAKDAAAELFLAKAATFKGFQWDEVYASSGSAKMLTQIVQQHRWGKTITPKRIESIEKKLKQYRDQGKTNFPGLHPQRHDLLVPGFSIMAAAIDVFDIKDVKLSLSALREGILHQMSQRRVDYRLTEELS